MNWKILTIAIVLYLCTFCLKNIHGTEILSCKKDQKCLQYRKCQPAVKIAKQILATTDIGEKSRLTNEFKTLRCGNFFIEKTVCCDQDQIQEPYYSKNMIRITILAQVLLILVRPYSHSSTAHLRICTSLSWPKYCSFRMVHTYSLT